MRLLGLALVALMTLAAPAAAQIDPIAEARTENAGDLAAQRSQFQQWIGRLMAADGPGANAIEIMRQAMDVFGRSDASPAAVARMRTAIVAARAEVARSTALFEQLDTPEFPLLELPEAVSTAAMRRDAMAANNNRLGVLAATDQMMMGVARRDQRMMYAGAGVLLAASRDHVRMLARISDARAAVFPPGSLNNLYNRLLSVIYRGGEAMVGAVTPTGAIRTGPQFQGKIGALIKEVDEIISIAGFYTTQEREAIDAAMAEARAAGDSARIAELEVHDHNNAIALELMAQGRALAAHLRTVLAAARRGGPLSQPALRSALDRNMGFEAEIARLIERT